MDIKGIYTGIPDDAWYPNTIEVTMGDLIDKDVDGTYIKIDSGGGGVVYLNEDKNTILKVKFYSSIDDTEVKYQKMAGDLAPAIFYDSFREVNTDIADKKAFGGGMDANRLTMVAKMLTWREIKIASKIFSSIILNT